ncbi:unnamed protein product [Cercospora beticola]|nr:unnamed protein product [Cercospora beticola]
MFGVLSELRSCSGTTHDDMPELTHVWNTLPMVVFQETILLLGEQQPLAISVNAREQQRFSRFGGALSAAVLFFAQYSVLGRTAMLTACRSLRLVIASPQTMHDRLWCD